MIKNFLYLYLPLPINQIIITQNTLKFFILFLYIGHSFFSTSQSAFSIVSNATNILTSRNNRTHDPLQMFQRNSNTQYKNKVWNNAFDMGFNKDFFKILMFQYDLNFSKYLISNFHIFIRHLKLQNMTWLCIETTWTYIDMISSMTGSRCYISRENYQRSGHVISFVPVQRLWILLYHLHSQATPAKPHNPHSGRSFCKTYTLMCPPSLRGVKPRKDEIAGSEWP